MPTCSWENSDLSDTVRKHGTPSIVLCPIGRQQDDASAWTRFGFPSKSRTLPTTSVLFQVLREISDYSPDLSLPAKMGQVQLSFRFVVSHLWLFIPLVREAIDQFFELGRKNPRALTDFAVYLLSDPR